MLATIDIVFKYEAGSKSPCLVKEKKIFLEKTFEF